MMTTVLNVLQGASSLVVIIAAALFPKLKGWLSTGFDSYLEEKGKNLATKQDVEIITKLTEGVLNEYRESLKVFETNLKFKHEILENQYKDLYCGLYWEICQSEALRKHIISQQNDTLLQFEYVPLVIENSSESNERLHKIIELVESNKTKASPDLTKVICQIKVSMDSNDSNNRNNSERLLLEKRLVEVIINDYNNIRKELKLTYNDAEYADLCAGDFFIGIETSIVK